MGLTISERKTASALATGQFASCIHAINHGSTAVWLAVMAASAFAVSDLSHGKQDSEAREAPGAPCWASWLIGAPDVYGQRRAISHKPHPLNATGGTAQSHL